MISRRYLSIILFGVVGTATFLLSNIAAHDSGSEPFENALAEDEAVDNDWFMLQRVYPHDDVDPALYELAKSRIRAMAHDIPGGTGVPWISVGPSNIGGRVTSVALHPTDPSIIYMGAASGGGWKSTNAGGEGGRNFATDGYEVGAIAGNSSRQAHND